MYFIRLKQTYSDLYCDQCFNEDRVKIDKHNIEKDGYKLLICPECKEYCKITPEDHENVLKYITDDFDFIKRLETADSDSSNSQYEIIEIKKSLAMFGINDIHGIKQSPWPETTEINLVDSGGPSPLGSYGNTDNYFIDQEYNKFAKKHETVIEEEKEDIRPIDYFNKTNWMDLKEFVKSKDN